MKGWYCFKAIGWYCSLPCGYHLFRGHSLILIRKFLSASTVVAVLLCGCASGPQTTMSRQGGPNAARKQSLREQITALNSVVQRLSSDLRRSREQSHWPEQSVVDFGQ